MLSELKGISEAIQSMIALIGTIGFIYVVLMGLSFKKGRKAGLAASKAMAGAERPDLKFLSMERDSSVFWKDEALIQGGMVALGTIFVLLMYIVFMLLMQTPPKEKVVFSVAALLGYPNSMIGFLALQTLIIRAMKEKSWDRIKGSWWLIPMILGIAVGTFWVAIAGTNPVKILIIQIGLLVSQSNIWAYILGIFKGEQDAKPDFPLVRINLASGGTIEGLRFHRGTEQDYRFFNVEGEERIIPCGQIGSIEYRGRAHP